MSTNFDSKGKFLFLVQLVYSIATCSLLISETSLGAIQGATLNIKMKLCTTIPIPSLFCSPPDVAIYLGFFLTLYLF